MHKFFLWNLQYAFCSLFIWLQAKEINYFDIIKFGQKIKVFAMYGLCMEEGKVYILNKAKQSRTKKTLHSLKE